MHNADKISYFNYRTHSTSLGDNIRLETQVHGKIVYVTPTAVRVYANHATTPQVLQTVHLYHIIALNHGCSAEPRGCMVLHLSIQKYKIVWLKSP
jgi:hypothetical protein